MAANQLFVCGSFCEGMVHHALIKNYVNSKQTLTLPGRVVRNPLGYPFLIEDDSAQTTGIVYEIESSDLLWNLLDEMHGCNFIQSDISLSKRKLVTAVDENGEVHSVWAYYFLTDRINFQLVDVKQPCWMDDCRKTPPLPEKLTEKQRTYIKKLGASSGRDIVPIDLTLYRELMGLELIVDKGRRLALSLLGKEVYKYIGDTRVTV